MRKQCAVRRKSGARACVRSDADKQPVTMAGQRFRTPCGAYLKVRSTLSGSKNYKFATALPALRTNATNL